MPSLPPSLPRSLSLSVSLSLSLSLALSLSLSVSLSLSLSLWLSLSLLIDFISPCLSFSQFQTMYGNNTLTPAVNPQYKTFTQHCVTGAVTVFMPYVLSNTVGTVVIDPVLHRLHAVTTEQSC